MKVGVLTLCYNEEDTLAAVLKNWQGKVWKHLVLHSDKPWHGHELPHDKSERIAKEMLADFVRLPWKGETEQRNWGLAYLYECDYVLVVDADELYTSTDQTIILDTLGRSGEEYTDNLDCYRAQCVKTYFKTPEYALDPPDTHRPVLALNPKRRIFAEHRIPSTEYQLPLHVTMHHLTYLRSDERMWHKIRQFEHHDAVRREWYEQVWKKWTPEMADVRSYGGEHSKAVLNPMPQELRDLLAFNTEMLATLT